MASACNFLAGAFFVNAGYLCLTRLSVPILSTDLTETRKISGVRSSVHAIFLLPRLHSKVERPTEGLAHKPGKLSGRAPHSKFGYGHFSG